MHQALLLALLAACAPDPAPDTGDAPGPLRAGYGAARIPAPLGIGTAGYGPSGADSESPFSDLYPATTRIHGHPTLRALVLSRGEGHELVFLRLDTVGVFQQIRRALVLELRDRLGRDLDHALVLGATHTHGGPGRVIHAGGPFDLIADTFFPPFYLALVDAMADAVEAAWADLRPARLATGEALAPDGHADRRCEDGLTYTNDRVPLVAVERDGVLDGLLLAYAVHGTLTGSDDLTLTRDVAGAIEEAVEDRFGHPVHVMMFDSWGADMSPGDPVYEPAEGAEQPDAYDRGDAVGRSVAEAVHASLPDAWTDTPDLLAETFRVPLSRELLGYEGNEFDYEYGAVYCSGTSDCEPATLVEDLDEACLPFTEEYPAPDRTEITVGRVADLWFTTFTGEPGTLLAERVMEGMTAHPEVERTMFLGYAQDYTGYSILEEDWWQGGYEASGALWGPRQGEWLADLTVRAFDDLLGTSVLAGQPAPVAPFEVPDEPGYVACDALQAGTVLSDVPAVVGPTDVVSFTVAGRDPWLGAPLATLEGEDGAPVLRDNGRPLDSDGFGFWVDLAVDPPWEEAADARAFAWTFSLPVARRYPGVGPALSGGHRIRVSVPDGAGGADEVVSGVFVVE